MAPHQASALLRSAPSAKVVVRIDSVAGATTAPPRPWTARAPISMPCEVDSPPSSDAPAKSSSPAMKTRRRPSRSAARPPRSRKPAKVSVYALTTHCRLLALKPRSSRIEGSATFTIETSRMTMNCARQQRPNVQLRRDIGEAQRYKPLGVELFGDQLAELVHRHGHTVGSRQVGR